MSKPTLPPTCPRCGCSRSTIVRQRPGWCINGVQHINLTRQCGHCGRTYTNTQVADDQPGAKPADPNAPVPYVPVRCPKCGCGKCPVTKTVAPIRHHKCSGCGHPFQSREV